MAFELGDLNEGYVNIEWVGTGDISDIYRLERPQPGNFGVTVEPWSGSVEVVLRDREGNAQVPMQPPKIRQPSR